MVADKPTSPRREIQGELFLNPDRGNRIHRLDGFDATLFCNEKGLFLFLDYQRSIEGFSPCDHFDFEGKNKIGVQLPDGNFRKEKGTVKNAEFFRLQSGLSPFSAILWAGRYLTNYGI